MASFAKLPKVFYAKSTVTSETVKKYRKAAKQGDTQSQYNLGYCYYNEGVAQYLKQAAQWFQKARRSRP